MHLTTNIFISLDYTIIHLHKEDSKYRYEIICFNLRSVGFFKIIKCRILKAKSCECHFYSNRNI